MPFEDQEIVCLNECTYDYDTGYCLSCGRPPVAPEEAVAPGDANNLLARMLADPSFGVRKKDPSEGGPGAL
jgi:hypothetical protein